MEIVNEIDVLPPRISEFLWRESWNTIKSATTNVFHLMPVCFQNFVKSLKEYDAQSLRRSLANASFSDIVKFVKKYYFIPVIVAGVAMVTISPLARFALISSIKLLLLLVRSGKDIVSPAFRLALKWTALSMAIRTICHMDLGQLNPITSTISQTIVDPVSVFLTMGAMILAVFIFIASVPI
ncbi:MAG: hypothetical protein LBC30_03185 [Puniceicoccales bacterium]|jgi:hypothetical protein|nr:hypothetical protein [Puniceicoccales bacterium]